MKSKDFITALENQFKITGYPGFNSQGYKKRCCIISSGSSYSNFYCTALEPWYAVNSKCNIVLHDDEFAAVVINWFFYFHFSVYCFTTTYPNFIEVITICDAVRHIDY